MPQNYKPKPITGEDTQQFSADDVKQAGIKRYSSPRNQQQQQPNQNVAVQVTAMIVLLVFVLALLAAGTIITLNIVH